jgi:hypothetical protein
MDDESADHTDLQPPQRLSIPVRLLLPSRRDGAPPTITVGPRRKLVLPLLSTGQWIRQYCLDDLTTHWLAAIVGEEMIAAAIGKDDDDNDTKNSLQSMLIQAGDGNDVLVLIDHAEMPTSVANVDKVLTMEVAVGPASTASTNAATATAAPATTNAIINASDSLWPHVALAQHEDPTCCILAWTVRDSARSYLCGGNASTRRTSRTTPTTTTRKRERNSRSKQKTAFRLTSTRMDDGSPHLANAESVDVPVGFWLV